MLCRILEINEENRYLSVERGFVVIKSGNEILAKVPIADISVLLLSAQSVVVSKNILNALCDEGCMTVMCGKNYIPVSMVMPVANHCFSTKIIKSQINASEPVKKRIWQQVVTKKIENQSIVLRIYGKEKEAAQLQKIAQTVTSEDSRNREAYAARLYWHFLFGENFKRDKDGSGVNALLNYGYAVMRAGMARAICACGLMPSLGIHHDNNLNQFCLADDLFEIYRPLVDSLVYSLFQNNENEEVTPQTKKILANALWIKMKTTKGDSPAFLSMQYLASSYVNALEIKKPQIDLPIWEGNCERFATGE